MAKYQGETKRMCQVLDTHLADQDYIVGAAYSIADMACYPWIKADTYHGVTLDGFPHLRRWSEQINERPATQRALKKGGV